MDWNPVILFGQEVGAQTNLGIEEALTIIIKVITRTILYLEHKYPKIPIFGQFNPLQTQIFFWRVLIYKNIFFITTLFFERGRTLFRNTTPFLLRDIKCDAPLLFGKNTPFLLYPTGKTITFFYTSEVGIIYSRPVLLLCMTTYITTARGPSR